MTEKVQFELGTHREKAVIFIRFDYEAAPVARVKKLTGAQWSKSKKAWIKKKKSRAKHTFPC